MILDKDLILQFQESDSHTRIKGEGDVWFLSIDHANKLLRDEMSKWPVVYGHPTAVSSDPKHHTWSMVDPNNPFYTHRSRILPPQPIRTETAEDVLRDFVDEYSKIQPHMDKPINIYEVILPSLYERARKVLK